MKLVSIKVLLNLHNYWRKYDKGLGKWKNFLSKTLSHFAIVAEEGH